MKKFLRTYGCIHNVIGKNQAVLEKAGRVSGLFHRLWVLYVSKPHLRNNKIKFWAYSLQKKMGGDPSSYFRGFDFRISVLSIANLSIRSLTFL